MKRTFLCLLITLIETTELTNVKSQQYAIAPNPVIDNFSIITENDNFLISHINIYDINFNSITSMKVKEEKLVTIDTHSWRSGTYIVEIIDHNGSKHAEKIQVIK